MEKYVFALVVVVFLGMGYFMNRKKSADNISNGLILFPHWFKSIGIFWALASFVLVFVFASREEQIWKAISTHSINIGLFLVCFSKDKLEDELTNSIRLRAFYTSVVTGFCVVVFSYFVENLTGNTEYIYPAEKLITIILFVYAFQYASIKRKVFYGR